MNNGAIVFFFFALAGVLVIMFCKILMAYDENAKLYKEHQTIAEQHMHARLEQVRIEKHKTVNELMITKMRMAAINNAAKRVIEHLISQPDLSATGCVGCGAQLRTGCVVCDYCGRERRKQDGQ